MDKDKWDFIHNEILTSSINSGLARGYPIYTKEATEDDHEKLHKSLRRELKSFARSYSVKVDSERHCRNIEKLAAKMSTECGRFLIGHRFRIGRAQKILNLYLKYLWVLGVIKDPPHCPFDGLVIGELRFGTRWTKADSIADYKSLADEAAATARKYGQSIARWELKFWNKKSVQKYE